MKMKTFTRRIEPAPPYDFRLSADYAAYGGGRHAAHTFQGGVFSRALEIEGETVAVSIRSSGAVDAPSLDIEITGARLGADVADRAFDIAIRLVGAHAELAPFYHSVRSDDPVAPFLRTLRGLGVPQSATPFEGLALSILGQQISSHVARILRDLLVDTLGADVEIGGAARKAFPSPQSIADAGPDALRAIKFSARKAEYLCDIASGVASGALDLDGLGALPSESIVDELVGLRGVGPWTAHWMLVRAYAHPDGFPSGDLAVQRNLGALFGDGSRLSADAALKLSERWKPFRSFLTTHLFAAYRAGMIG